MFLLGQILGIPIFKGNVSKSKYEKNGAASISIFDENWVPLEKTLSSNFYLLSFVNTNTHWIMVSASEPYELLGVNRDTNMDGLRNAYERVVEAQRSVTQEWDKQLYPKIQMIIWELRSIINRWFRTQHAGVFYKQTSVDLVSSDICEIFEKRVPVLIKNNTEMSKQEPINVKFEAFHTQLDTLLSQVKKHSGNIRALAEVFGLMIFAIPQLEGDSYYHMRWMVRGKHWDNEDTSVVFIEINSSVKAERMLIVVPSDPLGVLGFKPGNDVTQMIDKLREYKLEQFKEQYEEYHQPTHNHQY